MTSKDGTMLYVFVSTDSRVHLAITAKSRDEAFDIVRSTVAKPALWWLHSIRE